mmetsp:Transcript_37864/g.83355  ORF Transcript_37864/g.83355 Transcript_37864/m.83355 type:complete len:205 (-) Transcript_37864:169-783(-)
MHASGMKSDRILSPLGAAAGTVKSPQPIIGKQGSVGQISPGRRAAISRARLMRMLRSTRSKSAANPEYGPPGVPSTIHEPNSGAQWHVSYRPLSGCDWPSLARSSVRSSAPRSEILTVPACSSRTATANSTSSPQSKSSFSMVRTRLNIERNCWIPCSRTYLITASESAQLRGTPSSRKPIAHCLLQGVLSLMLILPPERLETG